MNQSTFVQDAFNVFENRPTGSAVANAVWVSPGRWLWTARSRHGMLRRLFATKKAAESEAGAYDLLDATLTETERTQCYAGEIEAIDRAVEDWHFVSLTDLSGESVIVAVQPNGEMLWFTARSKSDMRDQLSEAANRARSRTNTPPVVR